MVVEQQVVVFAEQEAVGRIRSAAVAGPVLDVMSFAPGGRTFAAGPAASRISNGKRYALATCVQTLLSPHVERLSG